MTARFDFAGAGRGWRALSICPQGGQAKFTRGQMETARTGPARGDPTLPNRPRRSGRDNRVRARNRGSGRGTGWRDLAGQQAQPFGERARPREVGHRDRDLRLLPHAAQREPRRAAVEPDAVGGLELPVLHEHHDESDRRVADRFLEAVPRVSRRDRGHRQHDQQRADRDAGRERAGHDDRRVGAWHRSSARPSDLVRPGHQRRDREPARGQCGETGRQRPGAVPDLPRPAPDGLRPDDEEVPGHEQLGVGALHDLSQPAVLDNRPEHAQDVNQGVHVGAGRPHGIRHGSDQRVRELPQAAHRRIGAPRAEGGGRADVRLGGIAVPFQHRHRAEYRSRVPQDLFARDLQPDALVARRVRVAGEHHLHAAGGVARRRPGTPSAPTATTRTRATPPPRRGPRDRGRSRACGASTATTRCGRRPAPRRR